MTMKKTLLIAWKDLLVRLEDRSAFIYLLLTPFVLTLIMGAVFGGDGGGPSLIPVALVNLDLNDQNEPAELGQVVVDLFSSQDLSQLFVVTQVASEAEGRRLVDQEDYAAALVIPAGFTAAVIPDAAAASGTGAVSAPTPSALLTIYANPAWPIGANIVKAVAEQLTWSISSQMVGGQVSVQQLLASGRLSFTELLAYVEELSGRLEAAGEETSGELITLRQETAAGDTAGGGTDWVMKYYAPSMAIMFLSFGVTQGARTILEEERTGTLPRLMSTPTPAAAVLGGKLLSTFVMGLLQFGVLVGGSSLLFQLDWGDPLAVLLLSLAVVIAMTSLGVAIAAVVRSEEQVNTWGVAVLLVFGAISGSFMPRIGFPDWLKNAGLITPNAWALDGFFKLGTGGGLAEIWLEIGALLLIGAALFALAVLRFRRRLDK